MKRNKKASGYRSLVKDSHGVKPNFVLPAPILYWQNKQFAQRYGLKLSIDRGLTGKMYPADEIETSLMGFIRAMTEAEWNHSDDAGRMLDYLGVSRPCPPSPAMSSSGATCGTQRHLMIRHV